MRFLPILSTLVLLVAPVIAGRKDKEIEAVPDKSVSDVRWGKVINGVDFEEESIEGKVVVVEEWGVNCGPCIASLPELAKLARRYQKKGLVVVGLEVQGGTEEQVEKLLKKARVRYPVTSGGNAPVSSGGIPHACVFGADGKLVWHGHPADDAFEDAVKDALKALPKA